VRKHLLASASLVALLAGSAVGVAAQDGEAADTAPALVTGHVVHSGDTEFAEEAETESGFMQRGRTTSGLLYMSDPRLSGTVVTEDNADRFCDGPCSEDTYLGDVLWGTTEITNDGGTWTGTSVGTTDTSGGGGNITYYELVGSGGYEGLSAVMFEREAGGWLWDGVIFPGGLPPER
jgi:hypothetical protein